MPVDVGCQHAFDFSWIVTVTGFIVYLLPEFLALEYIHLDALLFDHEVEIPILLPLRIGYLQTHKRLKEYHRRKQSLPEANYNSVVHSWYPQSASSRSSISVSCFLCKYTTRQVFCQVILYPKSWSNSVQPFLCKYFGWFRA